MKKPKNDNLLDKHLIARLNDMLQISQIRSIPKYSLFLNEKESYLAKEYLNKQKEIRYLFYGGYENAMRVMLGVFPMEINQDSFPIDAVTISFPKAYQLQHKDVLGALMSLNIKREAVGDILMQDGKVVVLLYRPVIETVLSSISKIGKVGVVLTKGIVGKLHNTMKYIDINGTVSSLRLDCIVSLVTGLSRDKSSMLIKGGRVFLNYEEINNVSKKVNFSDILSIRGFGKYLMTEQMIETKKGRKYISLKKYI